jgi:hypothetical protein
MPAITNRRTRTKGSKPGKRPRVVGQLRPAARAPTYRRPDAVVSRVSGGGVELVRKTVTGTGGVRIQATGLRVSMDVEPMVAEIAQEIARVLGGNISRGRAADGSALPALKARSLAERRARGSTSSTPAYETGELASGVIARLWKRVAGGVIWVVNIPRSRFPAVVSYQRKGSPIMQVPREVDVDGIMQRHLDAMIKEER